MPSVGAAEEADQRPQQRQEHQVARASKPVTGRRVTEHRREAEHSSELAVGDRRGDHRREQHRLVDIVAVEDLPTEQGTAEGRPEDGADPRGQPGGHGDARVGVGEPEQP
jgi:hypothetical protein